jgi:3'-5' exoribonuclease
MIADLVVNASVSAPFAIADVGLSPLKKGGLYLALRLSDRTGEISARKWDGGPAAAALLESVTVALVEGKVEEYQGKLQVIVSSIRPALPHEYEIEDIMRVASRQQEEMVLELNQVIASISNPHLRTLLINIFGNNEFRERFIIAPGARYLHHACRSGLLQHTLAVTFLCGQAVIVHPELDRDLLLTGAILHDVGKVEELQGELAYEYSDEGQLFAHIVLTDRFITRKIEEIEGFPPQLANLLTHILLTHHGKKEWGSPIFPATLEALALHYADLMDAKLQIGVEATTNPSQRQNAHWTRYQAKLENSLYIGPHGEEDGEGESVAKEPSPDEWDAPLKGSGSLVDEWEIDAPPAKDVSNSIDW